MARDEIKIIHKDRTFSDQALHDLAHTQAACMCRLQFGSCTKENCKNCETKIQLRNCKRELSDYDLLRLKSMTGDEYANLSRIPENWMKPEDIDKSIRDFGWWLIGKPLVVSLIVLAVVFLICTVPGYFISPQDTPKIDWDAAITRTVQKTQATLRDVNHDGVVNCVDAAIIFKWIWDEDYPLLKDTCTIIRNYNPGVMNHLFIAIHDITKPLVYVEPRAYYPSRYTMQYNWEDKFDSRFNWYGETQRWLNTAK